MAEPVTLPQELTEAFCDLIASGMSMREACRVEGMPNRETIRRWLRTDPPFSVQYAKAIDERTDAWLEEIIDISDDSTNDHVERRRQDGRMERVADPEQVARSKLRVHARQWAMARMKPKKYGDRVPLAGDGDAPPIKLELSPFDLARRLAFVMQAGVQEAGQQKREQDQD